MKHVSPITTLFLDIGGVLLTNGWDHTSRQAAAMAFDLDYEEMEDRHKRTVGIYELGKLSLEDYLSQVIFYRKRPFTALQFRRFMFAQSTPYPEMLELMAGLKAKYGLKIAVVSNEGRELNAHRIHKFKLDGFVDCFISSCFVHLRKPDADIFNLALDIAQASVHQVLYIENRQVFIDIAQSLGIQSILHTDYETTCTKLASFGLEYGTGALRDTA